MTESVFQPFSDRLSRDIRNDLSRSLVEVINTNSIKTAEETAAGYLQLHLPGCYVSYINDRLVKYARALPKLSAAAEDPIRQSLILWDEGLFFEVHEILEHAWLAAQGEHKMFLQAMIRAAGAYIKKEAGFLPPAKRLAAKALPILERNRDRLSPYTDPQLLLEAMKDISAPPPRLLPNKQ